MTLKITHRASELGIIDAYPKQTKLGLLLLGRKRAGFDPEWGSEVQGRVVELLRNLYPQLHIPSQNIRDSAELSAAIESCRNSQVEVLILVQPTISDGRLAPLLVRLWSQPIIIWATPEKPSGRMISANSLVGSHVMAATLRQMGHPLEFVYGDPDDSLLQAELKCAVRAVKSAVSVRNKVFGLIGYHAPGFVDFHADPVCIHKQFRSQLYHSSGIEFIQKLSSYSIAELKTETQEITELDLPWSQDSSALSQNQRSEAIEMQARFSLALRQSMQEQGLDLLAFRCWPDLPSQIGHWPYLALAIMVSQGFPVAMEGDVDGAICGRIAESAGIGPVYLSDWLAHDAQDIVIWHTGAAPFQLARNIELSVQFNNQLPTVVDSEIIDMSQASIFRIWRMQGEYCMTALEGETIRPRQQRMATNGVFRTQGIDLREWFLRLVQEGMPHHICLVRGHHKKFFKSVARLLNFRWISGDE